MITDRLREITLPGNLVVVQVAIKKPGFFEEAGLLWAKLYHYRKPSCNGVAARQGAKIDYGASPLTYRSR